MGLIFSLCFQIIGRKFHKIFKWPIIPSIEVCFVETSLQNILTEERSIFESSMLQLHYLMFLLVFKRDYSKIMKFDQNLKLSEKVRLSLSVAKKRSKKLLDSNRKLVDKTLEFFCCGKRETGPFSGLSFNIGH